MWWETSYNNQKCLRPVKSGSNMRVRNEALKNRFNSFNEYWDGYIEISYQQIKEDP